MITRKILWLGVLTLGVLFLAGYWALVAFSEPGLSQQVEQAEEKWAEQEVKAYRIQVDEINDIWHWQRHDITVENGQVTAHSAVCYPTPAELGKCEVLPYEPEKFTVSALFEEAYHLAQLSNNSKYRTEIQFQFDPIYGFPTRLSSNTPEVTDAFSLLEVKEFEPLPE
jgi:hypothetical protein